MNLPRTVFAASLLACALAACDRSGVKRVIAAPANAIAIAPLGDDRLAVLAGAGGTRGVFILDGDGAVVSSFGVTAGATAVAASSAAGPIYVGIGSGGVGAIERYTPTGTKTRVVPASGPVLSLTETARGRGYALVGTGDARTLLPFDAKTGDSQAPMPADAGVTHVAACAIGAHDDLLTSGGRSGIALIDLASGGVQRARSASASAVCAGPDETVYAVAQGGGSQSLEALAAPKLSRLGLIDAPADTVALAARGDELLILQSADARSSVTIYPGSVLKGDLRPGDARS